MNETIDDLYELSSSKEIAGYTSIKKLVDDFPPFLSSDIKKTIINLEMNNENVMDAFAKIREFELETDRSLLSKLYSNCKIITDAFEDNLPKSVIKNLAK